MRHPSLKIMLLAVLALALYAQRAHGQSVSTQPAECPVVKVSCPDTMTRRDAPTYTAEIQGAAEGVRLGYNWVVSAGRVVGGQGTSSVKVEAGAEHSGPLTATVGVSGLPASCEREAACTVLILSEIIGCGLDEYGDIRFDDEKARLDNLAIELQNDPLASGYLICYGGRVGRAGEARRRCDRAKSYLNTHRGIEASRIVTVDGGYRAHLTVKLWVVPSGATFPAPTPTVDPREVKIIKAKGARVKRPRT